MAAQYLDPQPVGRGTRFLPAPTPEDLSPAVPSAGGQLIRQTALADAGFTAEQDDTTTPGGGGLERVEQCTELLVTTNEGGPWLQSSLELRIRPHAGRSTEHNRPEGRFRLFRTVGWNTRTAGRHAHEIDASG